MKKIIFLLSTAMLLLAVSCTKDIIHPQKCTLDEIAGTWIWTLEDGESVPNPKIEIGTIKADGTEEYWSIADDKWTKTLNPISITEDGILHLSDIGDCYIVNFDQLTLTIETKKDRVRYSANRVMNITNEQAVGTWTCDEYKVSESVVCKNYQLIINEDGTYIMSYNGAAESISGKYGFCNDFFIYQSNRAGTILFVFGMDETGLVCKHLTKAEDGTLVQNTMHKKSYQSNLETQLAGGWIWTRENDVRVPTSNMELSFYNPMIGIHDYQTFGEDAEHILEPYYLDGRTIRYPEDTEDLPYETIMSIDDSLLVTKGSDGITYRASRIFMENPLNEKIIGTWDCREYIDGDTNRVTHVFDRNGLVICKENDTKSFYGTYRLYNSLLIMQFSDSDEIETILWIIKDKKIENGTMTFSRLLKDGTSIENVLVKR